MVAFVGHRSVGLAATLCCCDTVAVDIGVVGAVAVVVEFAVFDAFVAAVAADIVKSKTKRYKFFQN